MFTIRLIHHMTIRVRGPALAWAKSSAPPGSCFRVPKKRGPRIVAGENNSF